MAYQLSPSEVATLFQIRSPSDVETFLQSILGKADWDWRPLGDRPANAANVETTSEPGPGIVERIVNGIDAMLELAQMSSQDTARPPASPRLAAERYFGIPGGTLFSIDHARSLLNSLAPNVRVDAYESGIRKTLSVGILDRGIGQHPDDLPSTILSLGASNKISKHYVCGAYGQGGSATFAWCPYSIIVSRIRPEHTNERPDLVGWTIVRKYDDVSLKQNTYQYLVTDELKIPTFYPHLLQGTPLEYGTYIMHIAYQAERLVADWSIVGYRYFNNYLFDPVLPYTIRDHKERRPQDRYIYGTLGRLADAPVLYRREENVPLGSDGTLRVRYWVFQPRGSSQEEAEVEESVKLDSYLETHGSNRTVVVTLNGQKHAYLSKAFIKKVTKLSLVADSLLVQVDCDQLSQLRKKEMFTANRSGVRSGEGRMELIERAISQALDDPELRRINAQMVRNHISRVDEEEERKTLKILQRLIDITRPEETAGVTRVKDTTQSSIGEIPFHPKDPPTYFAFADEKRPLQMEPGDSTRIDIKTDGPSNMLTRERHRANLSLELIGSQEIRMHRGRLRDGRLQVLVTVGTGISVNSRHTLRATLQMAGGTYFVTERPCIIVSPPPPYLGVDPPTFLRFAAKGEKIQLRKGQVSRIQLQSDCQNDFLSRVDRPGQFHFDCSLDDVNLIGWKYPYKGEMELKIKADASLETGSEGRIEVSFETPDGVILEDVKGCFISEPRSEDRSSGHQQTRVGNVKIIRVWREPPADEPEALTWDSEGIGWDEENVGKYAIDQDEAGNDLLLIYVNMDHSELVRERNRRLQVYGAPAVKIFERRYAAYNSYHLWLYRQQAESTATAVPRDDHGAVDIEEDVRSPKAEEQELAMEKEMQRVAKTIIQALRSESDILSEEVDID